MLIGALLAATKSSSSGFTYLLIILAVYFAVWYFFLRPRWARNRQNRTRGAQVEVGDKVQTIGGLIATVERMDDRTVTVRTDSGVSLEFLRAAIGAKFQPPVVDEPESDSDSTSNGDSH